jgi:hypothetical protein
MIRPACVLVACALAAGCLRPAPPPDLPGGVTIQIERNDAALPAAQRHLHAALAEAVHRRFGWTVRADAPNRLAVALAETRVRATGGDDLGVTARWSVQVTGTVLATTPTGSRMRTFTGTAYTGGLQDEPAAIAAAAEAAASDIATWLDTP